MAFGSKYFAQKRFGPRMLRICEDLSGFATFDDDTVIDEHGVVGNFTREADLVRDDDHRHARSGEVLHDVEHLPY
jgi:hypothetical protein